MRKTFNGTSATHRLAISLVAASTLALGATAVFAQPITSGKTIIVRAMMLPAPPAPLGPPSLAQRVGTAVNPNVNPPDDLNNLSVNCSDMPGVTEAMLRPAGANSTLVSTLNSLRSKRKDVTVVRNPTPGNPFHCLVSNITPNQFVAGSRLRR